MPTPTTSPARHHSSSSSKHLTHPRSPPPARRTSRASDRRRVHRGTAARPRCRPGWEHTRPCRGAGWTTDHRWASRRSRCICSPSSAASPRSQPSLEITTTAPRATPRCPTGRGTPGASRRAGCRPTSPARSARRPAAPAPGRAGASAAVTRVSRVPSGEHLGGARRGGDRHGGPSAAGRRRTAPSSRRRRRGTRRGAGASAARRYRSGPGSPARRSCSRTVRAASMSPAPRRAGAAGCGAAGIRTGSPANSRRQAPALGRGQARDVAMSQRPPPRWRGRRSSWSSPCSAAAIPVGEVGLADRTGRRRCRALRGQARARTTAAKILS